MLQYNIREPCTVVLAVLPCAATVYGFPPLDAIILEVLVQELHLWHCLGIATVNGWSLWLLVDYGTVMKS